jgi:hypothetical protein
MECGRHSGIAADSQPRRQKPKKAEQQLRLFSLA